MDSTEGGIGNAQTTMMSCSEMRTEGTSWLRILHLGMFPHTDGMRQKMIPLQSVPALDFSLVT